MASHVSPERIRLVGAAGRKIPMGGVTKDTGICRMCLGSGTVSIWSEIAYFDDRRPCSICEAGYKVESKIKDILKKAQLEEHISSG